MFLRKNLQKPVYFKKIEQTNAVYFAKNFLELYNISKSLKTGNLQI